MAAIGVLAGVHDRYISENLTGSSTTAADTFAFHPECTAFQVVVEHVSGTPAGDVQLEVDAALTGTYDDYSAAISVATDGLVARFDLTDGPIDGVWRVDATGITDGTVKIHVVGQKGLR